MGILHLFSHVIYLPSLLFFLSFLSPYIQGQLFARTVPHLQVVATILLAVIIIIIIVIPINVTLIEIEQEKKYVSLNTFCQTDSSIY